MMIKYIQIFGLQCSGTNILQKLCEDNFNIPVKGKHRYKYGSKHGVGVGVENNISERYKHTLFLYIHKNIWAWICSMRNTTHGAIPPGLSISKAIRKSWSVGNFKFSNMIEMRNHVLDVFGGIESKATNWINIEHDMLVYNPVAVIRRITNDISLRNDKITITSSSKYKGASGSFSKKKKYYIEKVYINKFSCNDIKYVREKYNMSYEDRKWINL